MNRLMVTVKQAKQFRDCGIYMPIDQDYETPRLQEIALEQYELRKRLKTLDDEIDQMAEQKGE